jgi:hypothetical protein
MDMRNAGCDSVHIDAVGNVVGCYKKDSASRISDGGYSPISLKSSGW